MPTVEIFDQQNGLLSFDLGDLLEVIAPFASRLDWYVVEFEPAVLTAAQGKPDSPPIWVTELWHKSEAGAVQAITWEQLKELSTYVSQTMNALFVAMDLGAPTPSSSLDPNNERYKLVIQAVDTSFWAVTTHDEDLVQALKARFKSVKLQPATQRYF